jgi:ribosomal protein S18 acetylase RimI-like enzyme
MVDAIPLEILALTPDRLPDLAALFAEGGDPKRCWCAFWRVRGTGWQDWNADTNRKVLEAVAGRDPAPGLVAYSDGRAVGWVSVGPREDYERLEHSKVLARIDEKPVWSIVCFVVSKSVRGRGVATALADAAVEHAREHGATLLEAYPVDPAGGRVPAAAAYTGTVGMFERAGFRVVERRQSKPGAPVRPIVRRAIRRRRPAARPVRQMSR